MKTQFNSFLKLMCVVVLSKQNRDYALVHDKVINWALDAVGFVGAIDYRRLKALPFTHNTTSFHAMVQGLVHNRPYAEIKDDAVDIAEWIEENRKRGLWGKMVELNVDQTTFMDYLRKIIRADSEASTKWLESKVGTLKEPNLTKCFAGVIGEEFEKPEEFPKEFKGKSDDDILAIITNLAKILPGNIDPPPFMSSQKQAKEEQPKKFALWVAGRNYLQAKAKKSTNAIVRNHGSTDVTDVPVISVKALGIQLKKLGIVWPVVNKALIKGELVDDAGIIYTKDGLSLGRSIHPIAAVNYNTKYVADYTNKFENGRGGMSYLSIKLPSSENFTPVTPINRAQANKAKVNIKVNDFAADIDVHRTKWISKLKSNVAVVRMAATIIEIVYQTAIRIGSKVGAAKVDGVVTETFGLTVLKRKNAKALTKNVKLTYIGKSGQNQDQLLVKGKDPMYDKAILNFVSYLVDKKPNDFIFTYKNTKGIVVRFTSTLVNNYLRQLTGNPSISIHKFRHIKANSIAQPIIASCPYLGKNDNTLREVNKWYKEQMMEVGKELGHFSAGQTVSTTAIYSYIDPQISKSFFEQCNVQVPKEIFKLLEEEN